MNANENDFETLKKLLALKGRETPPPGYFNKFSSQVVSQIKASESRKNSSAAEKLSSEAPWLMRFLQMFEAKPAISGALASGLCLVLIIGIVVAERPEASSEQASQPILGTAQSPAMPLAAGSIDAASFNQSQGGILFASNSNNPVGGLQSVATLFSQPDNNNGLVQPVGFTIGGN